MRQTMGRGQIAEVEAKAMYRRVLAGWASDCLALRQAGLDRPGAAARREAPPSPGAEASRTAVRATRR